MKQVKDNFKTMLVVGTALAGMVFTTVNGVNTDAVVEESAVEQQQESTDTYTVIRVGQSGDYLVRSEDGDEGVKGLLYVPAGIEEFLGSGVGTEVEYDEGAFEESFKQHEAKEILYDHFDVEVSGHDDEY